MAFCAKGLYSRTNICNLSNNLTRSEPFAERPTLLVTVATSEHLLQDDFKLKTQ